MPALQSPQDLLVTELKQIHSAERQLSRVLPRLAKQVDSDQLREMLDRCREQGAGLIERIEDALDEMQTTKGRAKNIVAEALIEVTNDHHDDIQNENLIDPFVIAAVQKTEHYCIAAWGTAAALARLLEEEKVVRTMEQALANGKRFDEEMTKLAEEDVNPRMMDAGEEDDEELEKDEEDGEEEASGGRRKEHAAAGPGGNGRRKSQGGGSRR